MKYQYISDFISKDEVLEVIRLGSQFTLNNVEIKNDHIKTINDGTKGFSVLCDLSHTEVSTTVAKFQGDGTVIETVPDMFKQIAERISSNIGISNDNVFFQYINLGSGGQVSKHYDAGLPGYITYKCNICISGPENDKIFIDKSEFDLKLRDLYCFEANFYKHWMEKSDIPRIVLSYGFIVPLKELDYTEDNPRVRLSNRIWKAFISSK